jgi:hypothetical protein
MDVVKRFDQIRNTKIVAVSELELRVEYAVTAMSRVSMKFGQSIVITLTETELRDLSLRAYYIDRASAACRRSDCQLLRIECATRLA